MATATAPRAIKATDQPQNALGAKPKIKTIDEANAALRELAFLKARAQSVNAERVLKRQELDSTFDQQLYLEFAAENSEKVCVAYPDRAAQLEAELEAWADREYAGVKKGQTKTRSVKLVAGTIGWRKAYDAVVFAANKNAATTIADIEKAMVGDDAEDPGIGLTEAVTQLLDELEVTVDEQTIKLSQLVKLNISVERSMLLDNFKEKRISREILRAFGLLFEAGRDYFEPKPSAYVPPDVV